MLVEKEAHERDHKEGRTSSLAASNDPLLAKVVEMQGATEDQSFPVACGTRLSA